MEEQRKVVSMKYHHIDNGGVSVKVIEISNPVIEISNPNGNDVPFSTYEVHITCDYFGYPSITSVVYLGEKVQILNTFIDALLEAKYKISA